MAISGLVYSPTARFGICEEATFGTAIADTVAFDGSSNAVGMMLDCAPPSPDLGVFMDHEIKNRGGRINIDADAYTTQIGGTRIIPVNDIVLTLKDIGMLLYGVCQNVSEAGTTDFQKTYTLTGVSGSETTQPDFSANAGMFFTLGLRTPIASYMRKWTSAVIRSLTLKWDGAAGGDPRLKADAEFISGFTTTTTANFSGTWGYNTQTYVTLNTPATKQLGGADVILYSFELTITNNAVRVGNNSSGNCETYAIPRYDITGSAKVKYDANTQGAIAAFVAGTNQAVTMKVGSTGVAGYLGITLPTCKYTGYTMNFGEDIGQAITLPFKAFGTTAAVMATLEVCDAFDRAW